MLTAVHSRSVYSACAAMSAVLTASFAAVSSATLCLSSDQRNQDKLRKTRIQKHRNFEHPPAMFFCASSHWTRAASSSEDKEISFSLRAASAFRRATSFSSRALPFSSRVLVSVATVAFSRWSSASFPWSSASLRWSSASFSSSAVLVRCSSADYASAS